jgi:hypothetical protein
MTSNTGQTHIIQPVLEEKDLGVTVDAQLKFSKHVDTITKKANRTLGCLAHTFNFWNKESFLLLYKSMVRPILEYASCVWSPHLIQDQDQLERVQRRATRLVPELRGKPYPERLRALDLPTLKYRRMRYDLIQTFKIVHQLDKLTQDTRCTKCENKLMFNSSLATRTRGHSLKLQVSDATGPRKHFFATRVTPIWNSLREATANSKSVNDFKASLKKDLARFNPYDY